MQLVVWVLLFFFILLDILFAVIRAALVNSRLTNLLNLGIDDAQRVEGMITILEKPRLRATLRLMIGLTHILVLGSVWRLVEVAYPQLAFGWMMAIVIVALLLLLGLEFLFERIPLPSPEKWAIRLAPVINVLDIVFSPLSILLIALQGSTAQVQRNLGSVTEDDLKTWVEVGQPEGGLEPDERKMIYSIFQFGDTLCREIMIPRTEVLALDVKTPLNQAIKSFIQSGHSRVPVYDDVIDNIIGVLYAKDLLKIQTDSSDKPTIRKFMRQAYFVPESKKVDELLAEMQARGVHIAIVVDEYGGMAGLVTLEDIVEEIVGEIRDEYDQKEEQAIQEITPDEYLFLGRVSLDDFNEILDTNLETDQTDTLGGYFSTELGRVPVEGDTLIVGEWDLKVEEIHGRRVGRIRARKIKKNMNEDEINER